MKIDCPLLCVKNVYLHDDALPPADSSILLRRKAEDSISFVCDEGSLLQMSELGLPTSFSTTSFERGRRHKKKSKAPSNSDPLRDDSDSVVALLWDAGDTDLVLRSDSKVETIYPDEPSECSSHGSASDPAMAANRDVGFNSTFELLTIEPSGGFGCDDDTSTLHQTAVAVSTERVVLEDSLRMTDEESCISTCEHPVAPAVACAERELDSLLPWVPYWDDYYGRYYYHNTETMETAWEIPLIEDMGGKSSFSAGPHCEPSEKEDAVLDILDEIITSVVETESVDQSGNSDMKKNVRKTRRKKKACALQMRLNNRYGGHADGWNASVFKYWVQRYHLFSKFDAGLKLDEEGWFSVTPEVIAKHHAARCHKGVVVDAFTGVGGNAIQFALAGHYVVAIDNDPRKIQYAQHNALIYGVSNLIDFIIGDFLAVSTSLCSDVIFLSPPWGGPEYLDVKVYDINTMLQPVDGTSLFKVAQAVAPNVILFLPRNVNMNQLVELSEKSNQTCVCEVERNFLNGKLKAVTAYYGQFICLEEMPAPEQ